jgi:hypothetical protein
MLGREEHMATVDMLENCADVLEVDPFEFFVLAPDGAESSP